MSEKDKEKALATARKILSPYLHQQCGLLRLDTVATIIASCLETVRTEERDSLKARETVLSVCLKNIQKRLLPQVADEDMRVQWWHAIEAALSREGEQ